MRNNNLLILVRIKNFGLLILKYDRICIISCLEIWLIKLMGKYDLNINSFLVVFILIFYKYRFVFGIFYFVFERYSVYFFIYMLLYIY